MRGYKILLLPLFFLCSACAAMQTAMEYKDLELIANTQRPVFIRNSESKNLFLVVDSPIQEWANFPESLASAYKERGYHLVTSREQANIIMAIQIRKGDMQKHSARAVQGRRDATASASALGGAGLGYLISNGDPVSAVASGLGGLVVGGLADLTLNSWAYMGILRVDADVLVVEKGEAAKNTLFI